MQRFNFLKNFDIISQNRVSVRRTFTLNPPPFGKCHTLIVYVTVLRLITNLISKNAHT